MRLFTREQAQRCDQLAQTDFALSSQVLMESAGQAVADELQLRFKDLKKKIVILVGPGNNGADGLVTSRLLKRKGFQNVSNLIVESPRTRNAAWEYQFERAENSQVSFLHMSEGTLPMLLNDSDVLIDAIYGTGLQHELSPRIRQIVLLLNSRKQFVIAIDVPTGLDVNTGLPLGAKGVAVKADLTVTFGLAKAGFLLCQGPRHVGSLRIHQLNFPRECLRACSGTEFALGSKGAARLLPTRSESSHKSKNGRLVIFAGSEQFPGAGILVAKAAGRAGAGYTWLVSFSQQNVLSLPEVIFRDYSEALLDELQKDSAIVVGPGLGTGQNTKKLILKLKNKKFTRVLLDADALTVCAQEELFPLPSTWIMTPHSAELGRILDKQASALEEDRLQSARAGAIFTNMICVYKGFRTVISDGVRNIIALSGNAALSKAGSGDVLAGFIGALLAQGLSPSKAACLGTYIHGKIADEWLQEKKDIISLTPSDLIEKAPEVIFRLRQKLMIVR